MAAEFTVLAQEEGLLRKLASLASPMILANLAYTLLGAADTLFMGRVSTTSLGAVGLAGMMFLTVSLLFRGTINGTTTYVSRMYGAEDLEGAGRYLRFFLFLGLLISPLVMLLPPVFRGYLFLLKPDPVIAAEASLYVSIRTLEIPISLVNTALIGFMLGIGNSRTPMLLSWVTVGTNLVANYVLIFGKLGFAPLGLAGAAWGTVFAVFVQMVLTLGVVYRRYKDEYKLWTWETPPLSVLQSMARIGFPIGLTEAVEVGAFTTFFALISRLGADQLAASQIANQITAVAFMPGFALSAATGSLVGRYMGAKKLQVSEAVGYLGAVLGAMAMGFMGVLFWVFSDHLGRIFTSAPAVLAQTRILLRMMAFYQLFDGFNIVFRGALNGAGDTRFTMIVTMAGSWLVFVPLVYVLGLILPFGLIGAWLGAITYIFCMGVTFLLRFRSGRWKHIQL